MDQIILDNRLEACGSAARTPLKQIVIDALLRAWRTLRQAAKSQTARKHLRVCENVSLGDKRFVALIQVDDERFLIGGAASSIAMLARLSEPFSASLTQANSQGPADLS
jgi:flagellar biogenesis protein FliO